ncbi:serine hydrolase domain-containing protein [Piscinibacter gummiphilus]|uniref:Serine hydrolase domain-containing protein n=1 Tax=Piscinibacter gummiphilus TaxID=946333 RepID=A0ABZ0CV80_9BURK|nr:serine hydrolase domain-containing protein [Piscinibacter gummiphilus]WOB06778.1 serine hydrolase domain-containing protein [Piscinibacter gummiphilus]
MNMTRTRLPERASPQEAGFRPEGLARLTAAFQEQIDRQRLPGVVAMVVRGGKLAYFEALGRRDPALPEPMQRDSIFRIYSMTKPVVSVAVMMLFEEGRLFLHDPVAKYLPEFKNVAVGVVRADGQIDSVPAVRAMTVQDLLRHTSGLTYEILAEAPIRKLYARAKIYRRDWTNAEFSQALAKLPLMYQPGTVWDYSRATDVLGRLVEVVSGQPLRDFFSSRIFEPLRMLDTGFHVPAMSLGRLAEPFANDPDTGAEVRVLDVRDPVALDMGGGGLVSTATDYARFTQMLLNQGVLDGQRLLSRKTVELMTSDHLGTIPSVNDLLPPGHGFGLGFAVRLQAGITPVAGSAGAYFWGGMAGTTFWVDPAEDMHAVLMVQAPGQRDEVRALFRNLVYGAIGD